MSMVRAESLGKGFRRYRRQFDRLREWLGGGVHHQTFWAVRGVDLDVARGGSFGIVGDNGAGKSTLLAMLAGAAHPGEGQLAVNGRAAAILELGAGFHPEFTGRENLYLAATAQGLSRDAVRRSEADIVAFAELGEFIDLPVRTYSSGMFLRLAFAIATATEPEVLIIDEALAVGDQRFQAKCLRRIEEFRAAGGTLIFCSHNLFQVKRLCENAIWLERGEVRAAGSAAVVCDAYADASRERHLDGALGRAPGGVPRVAVESVELRGAGGARDEFESGEALQVLVRVRREPGDDTEPGVAVGFVRSDGLVCHCLATAEGTPGEGVALEDLGGDLFGIRLVVPRLPLLGGAYHLNVATVDARRPLVMLDVREGEAAFRVTNPATDWGVMRLEHRWCSFEGGE